MSATGLHKTKEHRAESSDTGTSAKGGSDEQSLSRKKMNAEQERESKQKIYKKLLKVVDLSLIDSLPEHEARVQIREICQRLVQEEQVPLSMVARQRLVKEIEDEVLGLGPLEPLLADASITDILVNGASSVFVERGGLLESTDVSFGDDAHLLNIIDRIVSGG